MLLTIITVSFNTKTLTAQTLRSVFRDLKASPILLKQTEIIVVDNASSDNSLLALRQLKKNSPVPFRILTNSVNNGFAIANNQAIIHAKGEYLFLLNSDTYVQKGCLEKLVLTMQSQSESATAKNKVGIIAASLLNPDGTIQPQGGDIPNLLTVSTQFLLLDDIPFIGRLLPTAQKKLSVIDNTTQVGDNPSEMQLISRGWVAATAMLVRASVISEIGLLDEGIFMYGEDVEFCLRAKAHHWDVVQHPTARVTHVQSASSNHATALVGEAKGLIYIWAKHKPLWQMSVLKVILRAGALIRMVLLTLLVAPRQRIEPYERIWQEAHRW